MSHELKHKKLGTDLIHGEKANTNTRLKFTEQHEKVIEIMKKNDFKILHKKHSEDLFKNDPYNKFIRIFNYIFIR